MTQYESQRKPREWGRPPESQVEAQQSTDRVASKAHDAVDRIAGAAGNAEAQIKEGAEKVKDRAKASEETLVEAADQTARKAKSYVHEHPVYSAGLAFAAGIVVSLILRK